MSFSNDFNGQQQAQSLASPTVSVEQSSSLPEQKAQAIQNNTDIITNTILSQRQFARQGQKVILGMGELHENGLHVIQQLSIIDTLKKNGLNGAIALEWPANNIDLHIEEIFKPETTDKAGFIDMLDAPKNRSLRNRLSADTTPIRSSNARLTRALLHEYMDDNDIDAFCTDTPRDWDLFIENERKSQHLLTEDPNVAAAVNEAMAMLNMSGDAQSVPPVDSLKQLGMLARNIYITNQAEKILEENPEIDVILIEAGRAHITGNDILKPEPSPYGHSMTSLAATHSEHIFIGAPIYTSQEDKAKNTPPQALADPLILNLGFIEKSPFNTNSSKTSDLKEAENLQSLSPYFSFIGDTLRGRAPAALHQERKQALVDELRDLRDDNGFKISQEPQFTPV